MPPRRIHSVAESAFRAVRHSSEAIFAWLIQCRLDAYSADQKACVRHYSSTGTSRLPVSASHRSCLSAVMPWQQCGAERKNAATLVCDNGKGNAQMQDDGMESHWSCCTQEHCRHFFIAPILCASCAYQVERKAMD